jgi:hypothetical protein
MLPPPVLLLLLLQAQHAAGNTLKYVLHYSLTSSPSSTAGA